MNKALKKWIIRKVGKNIVYLRLPPVSRILSDRILNREYRKLQPGKVLFVGAGYKWYYKTKIPHAEFLTVDIDDTHQPDILSDVHDLQIADEQFDVVVMTRVLEHLPDPRKAISEVRRVLKPGGTAIFSAPFIHKYHASPRDYWRFTHEGLAELCRDFADCRVLPYGNRLHVIWQFLSQGMILRWILKPLCHPISWLHFRTKDFPLGHVVVARK